jgi:hypothetical protein
MSNFPNHGTFSCILGTIGKFSMNKSASSFWTYGAKYIKYYFNLKNSMKSKKNNLSNWGTHLIFFEALND